MDIKPEQAFRLPSITLENDGDHKSTQNNIPSRSNIWEELRQMDKLLSQPGIAARWSSALFPYHQRLGKMRVRHPEIDIIGNLDSSITLDKSKDLSM